MAGGAVELAVGDADRVGRRDHPHRQLVALRAPTKRSVRRPLARHTEVALAVAKAPRDAPDGIVDLSEHPRRESARCQPAARHGRGSRIGRRRGSGCALHPARSGAAGRRSALCAEPMSDARSCRGGDRAVRGLDTRTARTRRRAAPARGGGEDRRAYGVDVERFAAMGARPGPRAGVGRRARPAPLRRRRSRGRRCARARSARKLAALRALLSRGSASMA